MSTLQASPEQKRLAQKLYEKRQKEFARIAKEIEADRRRVVEQHAWTGVIPAREARARLAIQANPLAGKKDEDPDRPTEHRLAKGDVGQHIIRGEGRKFRTKSPVEHYSGQWPSDVEQAFLAYVLDAHAKDRVAVTISYDGNGGSRGTAKLGGLGNVHDAVRDAFERFEWVRDRLTLGSVQILDWLVLELRHEATARSVNLEDAGQRLFPAIRDKATRRGIALGRLLGAGDELAKLYRLFRVLSHEPRQQMRDVSP